LGAMPPTVHFFGFGALFPLPPPEGLPVVLGAFAGLDDFAIINHY